MADPQAPRRPAPAPRPARAAASPQEIEEQAAPPSRAQAQVPPPPVLIQELTGWFDILKKNLAGFKRMNGALLSVREPDAAGRRVGMPILEFAASADDITAEKCSVDLRRVRPDHLEHVLVPLAEYLAVDMLTALSEIETRIALIRPQLLEMTGGSMEQQ